MLSLSASATYLTASKHQIGNFVGGIPTIYLVTIAWLTPRSTNGEAGKLDWGAILVPLGVGVRSDQWDTEGD